MDILFISHLYPTPDDSVSGIFVHQQAQALAERGHTVRVISPTPYVPNVPYLSDRWERFSNTPSRAHIDGIKISYPKYLSLPSRHTLPLVAKSVRHTVGTAISDLVSGGFSPNIINAHVPLPDGYACIPSCQRLNIPLVTTVHGASIYNSVKNSLSRRQIQGVFDISDEVVFNSGVLLSEAESIFSNLSDVHVLHNGIDLEEVNSASEADLSDIVPENRNVISTVGALIKRKNHATVIDAVAKISEKERPHYLIIGKGPNREALEQRVQARGIQEYVHFTGYVPDHRDVLSRLKSTDIMALPSTDEAFGIAYIEAMACECAVVGCEGEGPSEFVEHGETGYLVPPDNPKALTGLLSELLDNPIRTQQVARNASEYVRENLTWAENARKNEEVYQSAIERSSTRGYST